MSANINLPKQKSNSVGCNENKPWMVGLLRRGGKNNKKETKLKLRRWREKVTRDKQSRGVKELQSMENYGP